MGSGCLRAATPVARRSWWRRLRWFAAVALVLVVLYACRSAVLTAAARFLDVSEPPTAVDYVMVLGGGDDTRPFVAAALVKRGFAGHVLIPQTQQDASVEAGLVPPEVEVLRRVLLARGVPEDAILTLDGVCDSTRDEAQALGRFVDAHPACSVAIVTTTYHTRRARGLFRRTLGPRVVDLHIVAAPTEGFDATNWWRSPVGFRDYVDEFVKWGLAQVRF